MDQVSLWEAAGGPLFVGFVSLVAFVQLAWHVAVIVFLYKIWQRVKHLPSN